MLFTPLPEDPKLGREASLWQRGRADQTLRVPAAAPRPSDARKTSNKEFDKLNYTAHESVKSPYTPSRKCFSTPDNTGN